MMQQTLRLFISRMEGFEVCGAAYTREEALEKMKHVVPDLALIDMSLPHMSGAELVRNLQQRWPELPCVLLSGHGEANYVEKALTAGARAYILKGKPAELEPALRQVIDGHFYLSDALQTHVK